MASLIDIELTKHIKDWVDAGRAGERKAIMEFNGLHIYIRLESRWRGKYKQTERFLSWGQLKTSTMPAEILVLATAITDIDKENK